MIKRAIRRIAHVSGLADALKSERVLDADAVHRAGGVLAAEGSCGVAQRQLAVLARVAGVGAIAPVAAHLVDALAAVAAGLREALVDVELAVLALEARRTTAHVAAVVVVAGAFVQARVVQTLVDVDLAVRPFVAGGEEREVGLILGMLRFEFIEYVDAWSVACRKLWLLQNENF